MTAYIRTAVCAGFWIFILTVPAFGLYTPNPAGRSPARSFSLMLDFEYNSKDLQHGPDLDMYGGFVRPTGSPIRNMSIYGRFGFRDADEVDTGFAGGAGFQYAYEFPRAPEWAVGGAIDFLYWSADIQHDSHDIDWAEFQMTPAVSYAFRQVPGLVPYVGAMFDFVEARSSIEQDDTVGMLFGVTYDPDPQVRLEVQGRLISEDGVFVSAGYRF